MLWSHFPFVLWSATALWVLGGGLFLVKNASKTLKIAAHSSVLLGIVMIAGFITELWIHLDRPPMRTLGETRLWYGLFLPAIGYATFLRWKYLWILQYSLGLALLFLFINYMNPEYQDRALMPALQSPWFVPHVVVYLFAYAILGASCVVAVKGLVDHYRGRALGDTLKMGDNLVYVGTAFLTLGLLFGALWGKEAWGHYWQWDPKEVWALLTWIVYIAYIHVRHHVPRKVEAALWVLAAAFLVLLVCWFGVNYLPSAQNSVHTYSR